MDKIFEKIKKQILDNPIILYMKGSPNIPNCGFSSQAVKILLKCNESFSYVDILQHPDIRSALPIFSNWPTYPQLWINSELVGGYDIIKELYQKNELQKLIQKTKLKYNLQTIEPIKIKNAAIT